MVKEVINNSRHDMLRTASHVLEIADGLGISGSQ